MDNTLLNIDGLKTYFYTEEGSVRAVDNIDLTINRGEILGLVGESGCGKSTLGLSITRLIQSPGKILSGEILFEGKDLLKLREEDMRNIRGGEIAMIFQDPSSSLNPVFPIGNQIIEAVKLHQQINKKKELRERCLNILKKVGIADAGLRFSHYPHEFSAGMNQRVMIAMALSCNPKLLIADEPTTSLDVTIQAQILELLKELRSELGSTILLITHNLGIIAELSDKVAVMYAGKIVEYADVVTIFKKSRHPYTRALLASIPRLDITQDELKVISGEVPSLIDPEPGCRFYPRCEYATKNCEERDPIKVEVEPGHIVYCTLVDEVYNY